MINYVNNMSLEKHKAVTFSYCWHSQSKWPKRPWSPLGYIVICVNHSGITAWSVRTKLEKIAFWLHWDAFRRIWSNTDFLYGTTMGNICAKSEKLIFQL